MGREAHRDTGESRPVCGCVTWAEERELPREIRGGRDKAGEDRIGKKLRREEIDFTKRTNVLMNEALTRALSPFFVLSNII